MNREQEIKSIKEEQRALADRLEALEKEEHKPEPKPMEIWSSTSKTKYLITRGNNRVALNNGDIFPSSEYQFSNKDLFKNGWKCLGTLDEVFIEREKVAKDYILRSEVREVIESVLNWRDAWQADDELDWTPSSEAYEARDRLRELL